MDDVLHEVRAGQCVMLDHSSFRGLEFKVYSVEDIDRQIAGESHPFRDVVFAVNRSDGDDRFVKLRSFYTDGTNHVIALQLMDERPFSQEFAECIAPENDLFHVGDDVTYIRQNGVADPYVCDATVHLIGGKRNSRRYLLSLYSREGQDEVGQVRPEFLSIEQETVNGSYQLWWGFPIVPLSVKVY